jgi:hypothetical protein
VMLAGLPSHRSSSTSSTFIGSYSALTRQPRLRAPQPSMPYAAHDLVDARSAVESSLCSSRHTEESVV